MNEVGGAAIMAITMDITKDITCSLEKIGNLKVLIMNVVSQEWDLDAAASVNEEIPAEKILEFDLLCGILDSKLKELGNIFCSFREYIIGVREIISSSTSSEDDEEAFTLIEDKLEDCEESLKHQQEQLKYMKMHLAFLQTSLPYLWNHCDYTRDAHILSTDPFPSHQLPAIISQFMSSENYQRSQAENQLKGWILTHPDSLSLNLAQLMTCNDNEPLRTMSALLLRNQFSGHLDKSARDHIHCIFQNLLKTDESINTSICSCIAHYAALCSSRLLRDIIDCLHSGKSELQVRALIIIVHLSEMKYGERILILRLGKIHDAFVICLCSANINVQMATCEAFVCLIQTLTFPEDQDKFLDLIFLVSGVLHTTITSDQQEYAQNAIRLLSSLAKSNCRFFEEKFDYMFLCGREIAKSPISKDVTVALAIEFLIILTETGTLTKDMIGDLLQFLMSRLLDLPKDEDIELEYGVQEDDVPEEDQTATYHMAKQALFRLSNALDGRLVWALSANIFPLYYRYDDWDLRRAFLIGVPEIVEGSLEVFKDKLQPIVNHILRDIDFDHPRVRWAALYALWKLFTIVDMSYLAEFLPEVIPKLVVAMNDNSPRVKAYATKVMFGITGTKDFQEHLPTQVWYPHFDEIWRSI